MKYAEADEQVMQDILDEEVTFYCDALNPSSIYAEYHTHNGALAFEPIDAKMFQAFLGVTYRSRSEDNILPDFSTMLAIRSQDMLYNHKDHEVKINRRVAGSISKGKIAYFMADDHWSTIMIQATGWKKMHSKKLKFLKNPFDEAQVVESCEDDLLELMRPYVNMNGDDFTLFVIYVVQAFSRYSSHFAAIISSNKGTGKSTLTKVIRALIDPSLVGASLMPSSIGDLKTLLANSYMVCFDNTAALSTTVSNVLCAAITGSKDAKRKLYTDCDQIILSLHSLVVLNGIDIVPFKSDLAERSLLFELQPISKDQRKTDHEFWESFDKDRSRIVGSIFNVLSKSMQHLPAVERKSLHRMADANMEMIAIAMALGISQADFQKILDGNKQKLQDAYTQMNPFVDFIVSYMRSKVVVNQPAEALYRDMEGKITGTKKFFPESPSALSRKLNQEKDALLAVGIEFSKGEKTRDHNYLVLRRLSSSRLSKHQKRLMEHRDLLSDDASTEN